MAMSDEIRTLSNLLGAVLQLTVSDQELDSSVEDHLAEIITNYKCPSDGDEDNELDRKGCELHSYVDSELSIRFQLSNTDNSFEIYAQEEWVRLLENRWDCIEYAVSLQIIVSLAGVSLLNKMNLAKINNLKSSLLERLESETNGDMNPFVKGRLTELCYQVLAVDCKPTDLLRLYKQFDDDFTSYILNSLAAQISDPLSQNYLQFENTYKVCRPSTRELRGTLQFFVEFNNVISNRLATIGKNVYLEIKEGQFCISNDEFIIGLFEDFEFEPALFYSLTLTIDNNVLSLYVDGRRISELSLLEDSITSTNHIELGSMICSFKLFRFVIYEDVLSAESIKIIYALRNTFRESFDSNFDVPGLMVKLGDAFLERLTSTPSPSRVSLKDIFKQIGQLKREHILIILDPSDESGLHIFDKSSSSVHIKLQGIEDSSDDLGVGKCLYYKGANLISMFSSVNCFRFIFCAVQDCQNFDMLYSFLSHLMTLLRNDCLRNWFEKDFGFPMLSHILVTKVIRKVGRSLPIQFLNLFQEYCGWDFSNISNSFIGDEVAYRNLILNFDLWYCYSSTDGESFAGVEIIRFLFFQISSLLGSSHYQKFNSQKLISLDLLENICYLQHFFSEKYGSPNVFYELKTDLTNVYLSLLKENVTKANVQWLLQFSYFELKSGIFENAEVAMNAVDLLFTEFLKIGDSGSVQVFTDSVSPKFLLMVLDEVLNNKGNPAHCLNILFKLLFRKPLVFKNFIKSNGMDLLFDILKNTETSYYESLICLLYARSLGNYDMVPGPGNFAEFEDDQSVFELEVLMKEPFYLAIDLLEWAVINDIRMSNPSELNDLIAIFLSRLSSLLKNPQNCNIFDPRVSPLIMKLNSFFITLTKPQNTSIYESSSEMIKDVICGGMLRAIKAMNFFDFEKYLEALTNSCKYDSNATAIELGLDSNFFEASFLNNFFVEIYNKLNDSEFTLESELTKNPLMLSNLVMFFDKFKRKILTIKFSTSEYLVVLKSVLSCVNFTFKNGINISKNVTKAAEMDMLTHVVIALLYPAFQVDSTWGSKSLEELCKILENYQLCLFDCDNGFCEKGLIKFILSFLLAQLEYQPHLTHVVCCLKAILTRRWKDLPSFAESLGVESSADLKTAFIEICLNEQNIPQAIQNSILFSDAQKGQAIEYALKRMKLTTGINIIDQKGLGERITKYHILQLDTAYHQKRKKHRLFTDDNVTLDKRITSIYRKFYTNFVTDMEQDTVVHDNELSFMAFQHSHTLFLQENLTDNCTWELDSVEDFNRMRRRLLPAPRDFDNELPSTSKGSHIDTKEPGTRSRQWRSNSSLSYDIISDLESIDLSMTDRKDENRKVLKVLKGKDSIKNVWNCSLVIGLDVREGILIIGNMNVYFISNYYFIKNENKVIKLSEVSDAKRDINIGLITGSENRTSQQSSHEVHMWQLSDLIFVTKRPFLLRDVAIELLFENGTNCLISFDGKQYRDVVYSYFEKLPKNRNIDPVLLSILRELNTRSGNIGTKNGITKASLKSKVFKALSSGPSLIDGFAATTQWQKGEISNFYYLIILNTLAGRTFNDLTQYPIFPWVLADYKSNELDLSDPLVYRDLSKPMGAQSKRRETQFIERYQALESLDDENSLPFHYGTHYSSAMIVSSYMIRLKPFADSFLLLQDGKFGHADRLFNAVGRAWSSAAIENTTDVRELIPEFFFLPEFFQNLNSYMFGKGQNGKEVNDVILPPWAKGDPKTFVWRNREALESTYVSEHLNEWIDLIFGFKQRGENAVTSVNVFNNLSYPGAVNLDSINDETERRAVTGIIHNFGQTPLQIFQEPHPPKQFTGMLHINRITWSKMKTSPSRTYQAIFGKRADSSVRYIYRQTDSDGSLYWNGYPFLDVMIKMNDIFLPLKLTSNCSIQIGSEIYEFIHHCQITAFTFWKQNKLITGDKSGLIQLWGYCHSKATNKLSNLGKLYGHLSSIKDMRLYPDYNTLVSVDVSGVVYVWDLIKFRLIRRLSSSGSNIAISQNHGSIAISSTEQKLYVYNLNGLFYTSLTVDCNRKITRLEFLNFSGMDLGRKRHAYWKEKEVIIVGYLDGSLEVYELVLDEKAYWCLKLLKRLETCKGCQITCIKTQLRIHPLDNGEQNPHDIPKIEIMAGDSRGNLFVWG
ncbi:ZYBA0S03-03488g1_1 [Zygosaccharomyces bailii CLIB 213]|uniref:Beige protein homolog 1 n=1 Tax=Zygosaccharomyces bailii (strain CLIB 213 / ATCC 58445 / CBS 680 / BCRC 21525 / NBRC 1098 / NCYC 1416 / NRRL Y-2227) TaxID=1333698 RepID=A0A8J2WY13_ZYGB2|nr:ZYBA0S03-03488g1_1 [Zygosaccharomyces bailii CLIB 213]